MSESEWISAQDRLPPEGLDVLVCMDRAYFRANGTKGRKRSIGIGWHVGGRWHVDGYMDVVGLFWMPLPKPPRNK